MTPPHKTKILFVTSSSNRWPNLEWLCQYLPDEQFEVAFVVLHEGKAACSQYLRATGVTVLEVHYTGKLSPLLVKGIKMFKAALDIAKLCRQYHYDIVHAQFYQACIPALLGAKLAGVQYRIYTRHYAADPPGEPQSWRRRVSERCINALSTGIVAPSLEVVKQLVVEEAVAKEKVQLVHHGFDLKLFTDIPDEDIQRMRKKHGIRSDGPVIGVVSRYCFIKGIQYILPAFKRLLESYPNAQLVLASADGEYEPQLRPLLNALPRDSYAELTFEEDVFTLFQTFDVFVHVPIAPNLEAFGQVFIEALASGIPSLFTSAGITSEVINHKQHAWVVPHKDTDAIHDGLKALLEDPQLRLRLAREGKLLVEERFGVDTMIDAMKRFYRHQLGLQ